jgi:hypothetical protein
MVAIRIADLSYEPRDAPFLIVALLIIVGALGLFMVLLLRHRMRTWNQHRCEGLLPAGTAIFLDGKAPSVGCDIFPWSSLAIDQVELMGGSMLSGDTSILIHMIERLSLLARTKAVALDRAMMENGPQLVDNAWRKAARHSLNVPHSLSVRSTTRALCA